MADFKTILLIALIIFFFAFPFILYCASHDISLKEIFVPEPEIIDIGVDAPSEYLQSESLLSSSVKNEKTVKFINTL